MFYWSPILFNCLDSMVTITLPRGGGILVQGTKKMDCPAKIHMREIMTFPQYKIHTNKTLFYKEHCYAVSLHFLNIPPLPLTPIYDLVVVLQL